MGVPGDTDSLYPTPGPLPWSPYLLPRPCCFSFWFPKALGLLSRCPTACPKPNPPLPGWTGSFSLACPWGPSQQPEWPVPNPPWTPVRSAHWVPAVKCLWNPLTWIQLLPAPLRILWGLKTSLPCPQGFLLIWEDAPYPSCWQTGHPPWAACALGWPESSTWWPSLPGWWGPPCLRLPRGGQPELSRLCPQNLESGSVRGLGPACEQPEVWFYLGSQLGLGLGSLSQGQGPWSEGQDLGLLNHGLSMGSSTLGPHHLFSLVSSSEMQPRRKVYPLCHLASWGDLGIWVPKANLGEVLEAPTRWRQR